MLINAVLTAIARLRSVNHEDAPLHRALAFVHVQSHTIQRVKLLGHPWQKLRHLLKWLYVLELGELHLFELKKLGWIHC